MKQILLLLFVCCAFGLRGQVISTVAGGGIGGVINGAPATMAVLSDPTGGIFDGHGNYYFTEGLGGHRIRKIDPYGIISTVAGTGLSGYTGDNGPATLATLNAPISVIVDSFNNLYICDVENFRVRKVNALTGVISTIAGNGIGGFVTDGVAATATQISNIEDLCIDKNGNLYIADYGNRRVRKVNTLGVISTFAGSGLPGYSGDGSRADTCRLGGIAGICMDQLGNIYLADNSNSRVFKINSSGIITTVAGTGSGYLFNGDNIPATSANIDPYRIAFDKFGNLFISEYHNYRVRVVDHAGLIHTIAGVGSSGYSGDGDAATAAKFNFPIGVAFDTCDNLYISDNGNNRIRKVTYLECNYLSVDDNQPNITITISPNPTTSTLQINNLKTTSQYQLYNMLGASIMQGTLKPGNSTLPMDALEPDIYMLALIDEEGEKTVHKIVKQ